MNMMSLSLSDALKTFVDEQAADNAFANSDDYVRSLIQHAHDREELRRKIQEGLDSPPDGEMNDAFFDELRAQIGHSARG